MIQKRIQNNTENSHENEEFQSISSRSQDKQQTLSAILSKDYTIKSIKFPDPEPNTIRLFSIYNKNASLIKKLKKQITRLQQVKKENFFLSYDSPKMNIEQDSSQFFLRSQQLFEQRQRQLYKIHQQIKAVNYEQMKTIMANNQNIQKVAQSYFNDLKTILDIKLYDHFMITLTEQKKRNRKKRQMQTPLEQQIKGQLSSRSNSASSSENIQFASSSNLRGDKSCPARKKYMIRFINYRQVFPEMIVEDKDFKHLPTFVIPLASSHHHPLSFSYDQELQLISISMSNGSTFIYCLNSDNSLLSKDNHLDDRKGQQIHHTLVQIPEVRPQFDTEVQVVFQQFKNKQFFVLTSESILRVYDTFFNQNKRLNELKLKNILFLGNSDIQIGQVTGMCFPKGRQDQLLFTTKSNKLCKLSLIKYKSEQLQAFDEKIVTFSSLHIQTQKYLYPNYISPTMKFQLKAFDKEKIQVFEKNKQNKQLLLKVCYITKQNSKYLLRVWKNGLLESFIVKI